MGIRVVCPNGHRLHLKSFLAGRKGVCPNCSVRFRIPTESSDEPQPALPPKKKSAENAVHAGEMPVDEILLTEDETEMIGPAVTGPALTQSAVSTETWYVHTGNGEQYGPADSSTFQTWISEGRITPECLVWKDGWPEWRQASTLLNKVDTTTPSESDADVESERFVLPDADTQSLAATQALPKGALPQGYAAYQRRRTSNFGLVMTIVLAVVAILLFIGMFIVFQSGDLTFGRSN